MLVWFISVLYDWYIATGEHLLTFIILIIYFKCDARYCNAVYGQVPQCGTKSNPFVKKGGWSKMAFKNGF
jgi:hypothetical protein